jgi:acyl-CoA reductase-like NAD-dependent aldehyde dehydrogenase
MRNCPLPFALAISAIVVGCGFVLSAAATTAAAQHVATESAAASPAPAGALPQVRPDPPVDHAMRHLERQARVDMILYTRPLGQPLPGSRVDAVALTVPSDGR